MKTTKLPTLAPLAVHVWEIDLGQESTPEAAVLPLLSVQELERLERRRTPEARLRFLNTRAALRNILGGYLNAPAASLRFTYGVHGKPHLAGSGLEFNLTHSGNRALLAVGRGLELGIDLEQMRPRAVLPLARRFFHADEVAWLETQPAAEQPHAFHRLWCMKEAWVKAMGEGVLHTPLRKLKVQTPADARQPLRLPPGGAWHGQELSAEVGCAAALVTNATPVGVERWRYPAEEWTVNR